MLADFPFPTWSPLVPNPNGQQSNPPQTTMGPQHIPWYRNPCIMKALGEAGLSIGIDAIGFFPEAGGVARMVGHQAGYFGKVADQTGKKLIQAAKKETGAVNGLANLGDTSKEGIGSTVLTILGFIPVANEYAAVGSILLEARKLQQAIKKCN